MNYATINTTEPKELTATEVAKLIKREVPLLSNGKPTVKTRLLAVQADEVFAFKAHGDHVNVVTTDGRKLRGAK